MLNNSNKQNNYIKNINNNKDKDKDKDNDKNENNYNIDYNLNLNPNNANNGLITKIWGPSLWVALHCITFGYPLKPTNQQKKEYMEFFKGVGNVLPCKYCRESYKKFIKTGRTTLEWDVMKNRESFTKWFYFIHEAVNDKLDVDYGITYKDVVNRYESYRASCTKSKDADIEQNPIFNVKGCVIPLNKKAQSYKIAETKDCPVIPSNLAKKFIEYAKLRGLNDDNFWVINYCNNCKKVAEQLNNKNNKLWIKRNKECAEIILTMRKMGTKSIEINGKWKGLPTIPELRLLLRLSSNLTKETIISLIKKLPHKKSDKKKFYRLIK